MTIALLVLTAAKNRPVGFGCYYFTLIVTAVKRLVQQHSVPYLRLRVFVCLHWFLNPQILYISCQQYFRLSIFVLQQ